MSSALKKSLTTFLNKNPRGYGGLMSSGASWVYFVLSGQSCKNTKKYEILLQLEIIKNKIR